MTRLRTALLLAVLVALAPGTALAQAQQLYELSSSTANASAPVNISTATTTQLIAAPTALEPGGAVASIYVMGHEVMAGGTGNIQFVYGTGTNCGTGQQIITGAYPLVAQAKTEHAGGFGPEWVLPGGNALCAITSAAVQMSGFVSYRVK